MVTPPVFLDIEASGIAAGAVPVEIGWARPILLAFGAVGIAVRSVLVRPPDAWLAREEAWDPAAVAVHGLPLERLLAEGRDPAACCALLAAETEGFAVASDEGPRGWDGVWLDRLHEAAGRARDWPLAEQASGALVAARCRALGLDPRLVRPALRRHAPAPSHAAAEDALRFAWEWGMAELLGRTEAPRLAPEALVRALSDLPALVPPALWPEAAQGGSWRRRGA